MKQTHTRKTVALLSLGAVICLTLLFAVSIAKARRRAYSKLNTVARVLGYPETPTAWEGRGKEIPYLIPAVGPTQTPSGNRVYCFRNPVVRLTQTEMRILRVEEWCSNLIGWLDFKIRYRYVNVGTLESWLAREINISIGAGTDGGGMPRWVEFEEVRGTLNGLEVGFALGG